MVAQPEIAGECRGVAKSAKRIRRLEILISLRKMYRNMLRAQGLLAQPSPVFQSTAPLKSALLIKYFGRNRYLYTLDINLVLC